MGREGGGVGSAAGLFPGFLFPAPTPRGCPAVPASWWFDHAAILDSAGTADAILVNPGQRYRLIQRYKAQRLKIRVRSAAPRGPRPQHRPSESRNAPSLSFGFGQGDREACPPPANATPDMKMISHQSPAARARRSNPVRTQRPQRKVPSDRLNATRQLNDPGQGGATRRAPQSVRRRTSTLPRTARE